MTRAGLALALAALTQMAAPAPLHAATIMVPICGEIGRLALPLRPQRKPDGPSCKICHGPMRKRTGTDRGGEDDDDAA